MSSTEELEMAIETCKDMIVTAQKDSDKQKNLVRKLVQLRIKLQELKVTLSFDEKLINKHELCVYSLQLL